MLAVKIITPTGLYLEGECEAIHATTVEGEMTLLPSHMPVVAMLATSKLSLKRDGDYKPVSYTHLTLPTTSRV